MKQVSWTILVLWLMVFFLVASWVGCSRYKECRQFGHSKLYCVGQ
jgi:hypothetical protein